MSLFTPKLTDNNPENIDTHKVDAEKIMNQDILINVAKNYTNDDVKIAVINNIDNQNVLIEIAKNSDCIGWHEDTSSQHHDKGWITQSFPPKPSKL